jgi:hypothetical protein
MPHIDPSTRFWIGIIITIAIGVSNGSLVLKGALPPDLLPYITAWCGIISFVGSAVLTALNGAASTTSSRIASAAAVEGVKGIVVDPAIVGTATAAAGSNAKVST